MWMIVKKFKDILNDMASWIYLSGSKLTNFTVGSVIRSILEAIAMEIEDLYYYINSKFSDLQDNSIYTSFGFKKRPAIAATGSVTIKFGQVLTQSVLIPKGSTFYTQPLSGKVVYFQSTEDVVANVGYDTCTVPIQCTETGTIGNVPSYSITRMVNPVSYINRIYNENRFFTGLPEETKEEQQKRFGDFIDSLGKASTPSIIYGCMQVDKVYGVNILEGIGMIYVYAHDAYGNFNDEMKTNIENALYNYKAGGIKPVVTGVIKTPIDLDIEVLVTPGYDVDTTLYQVEDEVTVYLSKLTVSKPLIRADLIRSIMEINREAIANVDIHLDDDITVEPQQLIRPGNISVKEMGS